MQLGAPGVRLWKCSGTHQNYGFVQSGRHCVEAIAERVDRVGEIPDFVESEISLGRLSCLREVQPMGRLAGSRPSLTAICRLPESTLTILRTLDGDWVLERLPAHACTAPWVNDPSGYPPSFGLM